MVDGGFNISRAASALHATQPAISKQLRQFEEQLGVDLLLRQGGRPVALTDTGERTLIWARRALQCVENIKSVSRESGGEAGGSIVVATSHTHAKHLLLPAIVAFRQRFPRMQISVVQGSPDQVAEFVRDGKVVAGVSHLPGDLPKEVVAVPFLTSPRVLVVPNDHPLAKERVLTLEKLAAHPLVLLHSRRPQGARIMRKFQDAGLAVNVTVQALDPDVAKTYVLAGLGISIIPDYTFSAKSDKGLRKRDVGMLFDPAVAAVLLKRQSQIPKYVYQFLAELDVSLEPSSLQLRVFEDVQAG